MFDTYAELFPELQEHLTRRFPKSQGTSDFAYRQSIRARALDGLRGLLPAGSLSNVGIYGSGQSYELLLMRMRFHPLPEARLYAAMMLDELRKVIPSFLARVDRPERGGAWGEYMARSRDETEAVVGRLWPVEAPEPGVTVQLLDHDPDGEDKVLAAMCFPSTNLPAHVVAERVSALGAEERRAVMAAYVGDRSNRRHKPGRAFEAHGLQVRDRVGLRSVSRPAAAPDAHDRVAEARHRPRLLGARGG